MTELKKPANETKRLEKLHSYKIINKVGQAAFDDIVQLAAHICDAPISLITLITEDQQIFKAEIGLPGEGTPRDVAFCTYAILNPHEPLVVNDAKIDDRFKDNPLVTGAPHIEFYAGIPLTTVEGYSLGSLCVIDNKPRELSEVQLQMLQKLAKQVLRLFEMKKISDAMEMKDKVLLRMVQHVHKFTTDVAHDMRTSFRSIQLTSEVIKKANAEIVGKELGGQLDQINAITAEAILFISSLEQFTKEVSDYDDDDAAIVVLDELVQEIMDHPKTQGQMQIIAIGSFPAIYYTPKVMSRILLNLVVGSSKIKKDVRSTIDLTYSKENQAHRFELVDQSLKIEELKDDLFELFSGNDQKEKVLINNIGAELAIAKRLTEMVGGNLDYSTNAEGSVSFVVKLPELATA